MDSLRQAHGFHHTKLFLLLRPRPPTGYYLSRRQCSLLLAVFVGAIIILLTVTIPLTVAVVDSKRKVPVAQNITQSLTQTTTASITISLKMLSTISTTLSTTVSTTLTTMQQASTVTLTQYNPLLQPSWPASDLWLVTLPTDGNF